MKIELTPYGDKGVYIVDVANHGVYIFNISGLLYYSLKDDKLSSYIEKQGDLLGQFRIDMYKGRLEVWSTDEVEKKFPNIQEEFNKYLDNK